MNQYEIMLDYMKQNGSITGMESYDIGVMNYKARISELRQMGYDIESVPETGINRYGRKINYTRYVLHA